MTGACEIAGGRGDGDAGRQRADEGVADAPIAMEEGLRFAIREGGRRLAPAWLPRLSSE